MNLEDDILIERYLNNDLSELELKDFLSRLEVDKEFNKKVKLEHELKASFDDENWSFINNPQKDLVETYKNVYKTEEIQNLDKKLKAVSHQYQRPSKNKVIQWLSYAAAAIVLFLIVNTFFVSYTSQELYNDAIELNTMPSFVSREDANETELVKAQLLFEKKSYEKALAIFEKELDSPFNQKNASIYLYTGVTQMQLDDFESAETTFDSLISTDLLDAEKGKWYKALLYVKMERIRDAKLLLEEIISDSLYNSKKAASLLKKLTKIKSS